MINSTIDINNVCRKYCVTLGSIESFTGGLYAASIVKESGASNFFKGAIVTYFTEEKERLLGIPHSIIEKFGVVSEETAREMAIRGKEKLQVDYCISFTGNAGPSGMENKKAGNVFVGVSTIRNTYVIEMQLDGDRDNVREKAINFANNFLISKIFEEFYPKR